MRGFLRRLVALQKQNAFIVGTFDVTAYKFVDTEGEWRKIHCYIDPGDEDKARSFDINDYESVDNNEGVIKAIEAFLDEEATIVEK